MGLRDSLILVVGAAGCGFAAGWVYGGDHWKDKHQALVAKVDSEGEARLRENVKREHADAERLKRDKATFESLIVADAQRAADFERRLRDERNRRPLAPAESAPAQCGDFEARRAQLPLQDRAFLVREAHRADRLRHQLRLCQQHAVTVADAPTEE